MRDSEFEFIRGPGYAHRRIKLPLDRVAGYVATRNEWHAHRAMAAAP